MYECVMTREMILGAFSMPIRETTATAAAAAEEEEEEEEEEEPKS